MPRHRHAVRRCPPPAPGPTTDRLTQIHRGPIHALAITRPDGSGTVWIGVNGIGASCPLSVARATHAALSELLHQIA